MSRETYRFASWIIVLAVASLLTLGIATTVIPNMLGMSLRLTNLLQIGAPVSFAAILALVPRLFYVRFAPHFSRIESTTLANDLIWERIYSLFPERDLLGYMWTRTRVADNPRTLVLAASPLPNMGGCLVALLSGILPGLLGWVLMGRLERVQIRVIPQGSTTHVGVDAHGFAASAKADELLSQLCATPTV